jgi:A/G-specific adenine glycosylase
MGNSLKQTNVSMKSKTVTGPGVPGNLNKKIINSFRKNILAWYDSNRRRLPWRALPGYKADPYHVWLSEIMLQQTVVAAVIPYFLKFVQRWPTVHDLAAASNEEVMEAWAGLGYYARARNLHKCAKFISAEHLGAFPSDKDELQKLPGIGDYTSAAIAAIAFNQPASVVDGNVERVVARWFNVQEPLPAGKKTLRFCAGLLADGRTDRPGDFAQAMMDLGATVCMPKTPRCGSCPIRQNCGARLKGIAGELPRRAPKRAKPQKFGYIYWISNDKGQILFERRPDDGLLGGMLGLPTSKWIEREERQTLTHAPHIGILKKDITPRDLRIFHSFTHFDLELEGVCLKLSKSSVAGGDSAFWVDRGKVMSLGLPTLFKKFVRIIGHERERTPLEGTARSGL